MTLTFTVYGTPVPKGRTMGRRFSTPKRTRDYEQLVRRAAEEARAAAPGWRLDAPVYEVRIAVYREVRRGDLDNYVKSVTDAMNKGVVYLDDKAIRRIVAEMHEDKQYPRVYVEVEARS